MPFTLYRYMLWELLKLLALSTSVLVMVITVATSLQPLSEGLLRPVTYLRFVLYTMPTMLQFALPFAAAFSSTILYWRMTNENEIVACAASGLSYRAVLWPVLVIGLVLMVSMYYLSNWIVPRFSIAAVRMMESDLTQHVVSQVQKGRPVRLGRMILYADAADDSHPPPHVRDSAVQPSKLIIMKGITVGQVGNNGALRSDTTATRADALIYHHDGQSWLTLDMEDVTWYDRMTGEFIGLHKSRVPPVPIPNPVRDGPKFWSLPRLKEMGRRPDTYDKVRVVKRELADALAAEQLLRLVEAIYKSEEPQVMALLGPRNSRYLVRGSRTSRDSNVVTIWGSNREPVWVDYILEDGRTRRMAARNAVVTVEPADMATEPRIMVELQEVRVFDPSFEGPPGEHNRYQLPSARWPNPVLGLMHDWTAAQLFAQARANNSDFLREKFVRDPYGNLDSTITRLVRKVVAQLHERAAAAINCMLTLILGSLLSMKLRGNMPLVVFFWSFMFAAIALVIVRSGENVVSSPQYHPAFGLVVIWSGNLLLVVVSLLTYFKLARN